MTSSSDDFEHDMHHKVRWLKPSDRPILRELKDYGGWLKPSSLVLNLPYTRNHIALRCRALADHGLLERHSDDVAGYRITDRGEQFLADELSVDDLRE